MRFKVISAERVRVLVAAVLASLLALTPSVAAFANVAVTRLSTDPYSNTSSMHLTEVEPDSFSSGSTIVMATQVGRFSDGGSSNIGWATSTNSGSTWTNGFLPGTTPYSSPAGPYARVSDPAVAYDAAHHDWLIASLPINASVNGVGAIVNRSTDGGLTWGNPVVVSSQSGTDKDWIVCDNTSTSPFFGHCYVEFDNNGQGNRILMSTSSDGGATWGAARATANSATGLGGQPLVQMNGTVIVPIANANASAILAFTSTNGGTSWSAPVTVSSVKTHQVAGQLRTLPLPSAEIDGSGKVYVAWQDCRFRSRCLANDIVMSTSTNGTTWSAVKRIPIDATTSGVDHFIPGLAVDPATSGAAAHLGLAFYYYPSASCLSSTCQLDVGFVSSTNGGTTWTANTQLAGPMKLSWLPNTTQGRMVGDYISTSFAGGHAFPLFALASAPTGSKFNEAIFATASGLAAVAGPNVASSDGAASASEAPSSAPGAPLKQQ